MLRNIYYWFLYHGLMGLQGVAKDYNNERAMDDLSIMIFSAVSHQILGSY